MKTDCIQVFVSCAHQAEAKMLVETLLADQIIACAQIIPGVESFYRWQGQMTQSTEVLLLLKTRQTHFERLRSTIKQHHSYDVPEIIAVPLVNGDQDYVNWIHEETEQKS